MTTSKIDEVETDEDLLDEKKAAESEATLRHVQEAGGGLVGALGGAGLGIIAGPPGIVAGAVIGAVAGALTSWALEGANADAAAVDKELDEQIGVGGGDIGVPGLEHPGGQRGAYSAAAVGGGAAEEPTEADGPIAAPPAS